MGFYMKSLTAIFTFGMVVSGLIFSIVALYEQGIIPLS